MTGDGERRLRMGTFAQGIPRTLKGRSKRRRIAGFLLAFLCASLAENLACSGIPAISQAMAAGKGKANGNGNGNAGGNGNAEGNGNGAGNGGGNGNAGGNGNGNSNANSKGNGNGNNYSNDITDGNGIGIDLGDGVGVGIGVGNDDTIGVGIGISFGDGGGRGNQPLEKNVHKEQPSWHGPGIDRWPPGHGADKQKKDGARDLDLGEQFDAGRLDKAFGDNADEFGKLLGPADVSERGIDADSDNAASHDGAPLGQADHPGDVVKAKDHGDSNDSDAGAGKSKGNGKALGQIKEHGLGKGKALGKTKEHGNGKALAKGKNKNPEGTVAAESAVAAAGRENSGHGGGATIISAGSYVHREVLALGLSPQAISRVRQLGFGIGETGLEEDERTLVTLYAPARLDALSAISLLRRELPRKTFHLNRIYRPYNTATKDDPGKTNPDRPGADDKCRGDRCYGKNTIGWKDEFADCARDINVGVIDTDVDLRHPTFSGRKITRRAFLTDGKQPSPNAHGTSVLALLAGRPDSDTPGLIPEAKFFLANVFFDAGNGETITDTVSLLKSLEWMNASQTKVVNMSFSGPQDDLLQARLKMLRARGVVFTAAAGNEGPAALPVYPAAYPEVIAVTAVTEDRRIYPSANRGPYIDVAAPGVRIWTALPDAREGYRTGTSFATPFATAVLALQQPDLMYESKDELLDHLNLVRLGADQHDPIFGRGLLQAPAECSGDRRPASNLAPLTSSIAR